jgi:uncharacterized repeat protein (TIGR03803 family)
MRARTLAFTALLLATWPCASPAAGGPTFSVLYRFPQSGGGYPHGAGPLGRLVEGTDGSFYGVTNQGGDFDRGTVFKVTPAGALTTLHSFSGGDEGSNPDEGLALGPDGNLYGSTPIGGALYGGTLYRITPAGVFTTLVSFPNGGPGPYAPEAAMIPGGDGFLYGTTTASGTNAVGSVYRLTTGGAVTVLHNFPVIQAPIGVPDGSMPYAALVRGADGNLYGTAAKGGSAVQDQYVLGHGTVFRISPGGAFALLHSFTGGVDGGSGDEGSVPMAALVQGSDGDFYGTTSRGGTHTDSYGFGWGTAFRVTAAGALTTLHSFTGGEDGGNPYDPLLEGPDGDLYGTTRIGGGHQGGTVFRITAGGALTTLFTAGDASGCGAAPNGLILGTDGRIYGTTGGAGVGGGPGGTVFRISGLPAPPALAITTGGALAAGVVGTPCSRGIAATGGKRPYAWSIESGEPPPGLSLAGPSGVLGGIPTTTGTWTFTVRVRDSRLPQGSASAALTMEVHPAAPPFAIDCLRIDKVQLGLPPTAGHDSFLVQGSGNRWFGPEAPETVTLQLDSGWSVVFPASSWKRSGTTDVYTSAVGDVTGKMTYWAKGTSNCLFSFAGKLQTLQGRLPRLPVLPVTIGMGANFGETVTAEVVVKNHAARLSTIGSPPVFWVDRVVMTRNLRSAGRDTLSLGGRLYLAGDIDPASDSITLNAGPYTLSLPPGTLPAAVDGVIRYAAPAGASGRLALQINGRTHALTLKATGLDLSSLTGVTHVSLSIANHPGASWDYGLFLAANKAGTAYRY